MEIPPWPPTQLRDLRVLLVDDSPTNRQILERWLTSWRMEATVVGDGMAAMRVLWVGCSPFFGPRQMGVRHKDWTSISELRQKSL